jgi:hypothetical protein
MALVETLGSFGDERLDIRGVELLDRMVLQESVCLRRLAEGLRSGIVSYGRFLANVRVTTERLIEGWGFSTTKACAGRHVLAIQDTSQIEFLTAPERRRGLGKIGKGYSHHGLLLHAMLGLDAETGGLLGLVSGRVWTRNGLVEAPHAERLLIDKESERWVTTAETAKTVLKPAAMVTEVSDRESDIYAKWALVPEPGFHILTRAMQDRRLEGGGKLFTAPLQRAGEAVIELRERPNRPAHKARLTAGFAQVEVVRPRNTIEEDLPETINLSLVEVREIDAPKGAEPILWRLLTTHAVQDAAMAWQIVDWYRMRWTIEQFFRTLKQQGLQLEDSQIETADRLLKLTAIAARAACIIMQLVQARDGRSQQDAEIAFTPAEIDTLQALAPTLEGKTALQKNPHPTKSLAWAAWIIAKLGGWDGYPKSSPPGPITFRHGLQYFQSIARGWALRDV